MIWFCILKRKYEYHLACIGLFILLQSINWTVLRRQKEKEIEWNYYLIFFPLFDRSTFFRLMNAMWHIERKRKREGERKRSKHEPSRWVLMTVFVCIRLIIIFTNVSLLFTTFQAIRYVCWKIENKQFRLKILENKCDSNMKRMNETNKIWNAIFIHMTLLIFVIIFCSCCVVQSALFLSSAVLLHLWQPNVYSINSSLSLPYSVVFICFCRRQNWIQFEYSVTVCQTVNFFSKLVAVRRPRSS